MITETISMIEILKRLAQGAAQLAALNVPTSDNEGGNHWTETYRLWRESLNFEIFSDEAMTAFSLKLEYGPMPVLEEVMLEFLSLSAEELEVWRSDREFGDSGKFPEDPRTHEKMNRFWAFMARAGQSHDWETLENVFLIAARLWETKAGANVPDERCAYTGLTFRSIMDQASAQLAEYARIDAAHEARLQQEA